MVRTVRCVSGAWPPPTSTPARIPPPPVVAVVADVAVSLEPIEDVRVLRVRWAPIGVCALLGALVCALVVMAARPSGERIPETESQESVASAMSQAGSARTIEMRSTTYVDGVEMITVEGRIDRTARVADVRSTYNAAAFGAPGRDTSMAVEGAHLLIDDANQTAYISADLPGWPLPDDADWVALSASDIRMDGDDDLFTEGVDPRASLDTFESVVNSRLEGPDQITTIDGEPLDADRHIVSIDLVAAAQSQLAVLDDAGLSVGELERLVELDSGSAGTVDYSVWIDNEGSVRRVSFEMTVDGMSIISSIDMETSDEPLVVQLPPPGVIVSASDLDLD